MWEIVGSDGQVLGPFDTPRDASRHATDRGEAGQLWKVRTVQRELAEELDDRRAVAMYAATLL
jgi:hypothetical protein